MMLETVLVFLSVISMTNACSCIPAHPQEHFCLSQFVIRGKVISGPVLDYPKGFGRFFPYRVYTFRITKTYKGAGAMNKTGSLEVYGSRGRSFVTKIYTSSGSSSCGVEFEVGAVYVLAGNIEGKQLWISLCDFFRGWEYVTKMQRSGFARKYGRSCECIHRKCYRRNCGKKSKTRSCNYNTDIYKPENVCRDRYQYCQMRSDGRRCSWTSNALYRRCMKKIP